MLENQQKQKSHSLLQELDKHEQNALVWKLTTGSIELNDSYLEAIKLHNHQITQKCKQGVWDNKFDEFLKNGDFKVFAIKTDELKQIVIDSKNQKLNDDNTKFINLAKTDTISPFIQDEEYGLKM